MSARVGEYLITASLEYEELQKSINKRLENIHVELNQNDDMQTIVSLGKAVMTCPQ